MQHGKTYLGTKYFKMAASMRERFREAIDRVLNSWTVLKVRLRSFLVLIIDTDQCIIQSAPLMFEKIIYRVLPSLLIFLCILYAMIPVTVKF